MSHYFELAHMLIDKKLMLSQYDKQHVFTTESECFKDNKKGQTETGCMNVFVQLFFIERPQLLHITTVGFDKAKARMNSPANSQKKTKSFFRRGWEPAGMH